MRFIYLFLTLSLLNFPIFTSYGSQKPLSKGIFGIRAAHFDKAGEALFVIYCFGAKAEGSLALIGPDCIQACANQVKLTFSKDLSFSNFISLNYKVEFANEHRRFLAERPDRHLRAIAKNFGMGAPHNILSADFYEAFDFSDFPYPSLNFIDEPKLDIESAPGLQSWARDSPPDLTHKISFLTINHQGGRQNTSEAGGFSAEVLYFESSLTNPYSEQLPPSLGEISLIQAIPYRPGLRFKGGPIFSADGRFLGFITKGERLDLSHVWIAASFARLLN